MFFQNNHIRYRVIDCTYLKALVTFIFKMIICTTNNI
jgi:hypothetical protein